MKIKNIAAGDFVQIKKSLCHSEFKAKQVCEVIDIDPTDKYGFDVLIQGKNCLDWVNHNYLKKTEPQLKLLGVDLSSELTGSELCRAMLERGDKWVVCFVAYNEKNIKYFDEPSIVVAHDENGFYVRDSYYNCAVPVNRRGEPLTAAEVGL